MRHGGSWIRFLTKDEAVQPWWALARIGELPVSSVVARLGNWWRAGLVAPLPDAVVDWIDPPRRWLLLDLAGDMVRVTEPHGDAAPRTAALDDTVSLAALVEYCRGRQRRGAVVALRVPAAQALTREFNVVAVAPRELRSFLAARIDEYTPFSAQQVYFAYQELSPADAMDRSRVRLLIAPRPYVDPGLEQLRECGFAPDTAVVAGYEQAGAELTPVALRHRGRRAAVVSAVVAAGLAAAAIYLPVASRHETLAQLSAQNRQLEQQLASLAADPRTSGSNRVQEVASLRRRHPVTVQLLNVLSEQVPSHTWLRQLTIDAEQITLLGETSQTADLVAKLENSPWFENTRFDAALTRDTATNVERFRLTTNWVIP